MAMSQLVVDTFTQYKSLPQNLTAGNWSQYHGASHPVEVPANGQAATSATSEVQNAAVWTGNVPNPSNAWPADQYAEVTLPNLTAVPLFIDVAVRCSTVADTKYFFEIQASATTASVIAKVAGTNVATYSITGITQANGDVWRLSVTGTTLTVTQNGVTKLTQTDTNIASGIPGFGVWSFSSTGTAGGYITKFAAGAVQTAAPTFVPNGLVYIQTGTTQAVTVSCATPSATIHYTTDGTTPTSGSPTVASGSTVTITYPCLLQAIGILSGNSSLVSAYNFVIPTPGYGTLFASDNFGSGSLSPNWGVPYGGLLPQVVSGTPNVTEPAVIDFISGSIYSGYNWPNDQISELKVNALTAESGTVLNLCTRLQTGSLGGYYLSISNGTANIVEETLGGVDTTIATASVTIAAGDILTLESCGVSHAFYQNGKHIVHGAGAAIQSGTPGYIISSTVNITHIQVAYWRGYNCVQQDGVWQKQGIVLAPTATDLAVAPSGQGIQCDTIIYDTNPVILTMLTNVYKCWFFNGFAGLTGNVLYAESPDGLTWTRYTGNDANGTVLSGFLNAVVEKVSGTYYMRCQAQAGNGTGTMQVFTSVDGVTWVQQSPTLTISRSVAGWDDNALYPGIRTIDIIGGTWYAYYQGSNSSNPTLYSTGMMTSTDGINWVKYLGTGGPITTGILFQNFNSIGGTYYAWSSAGEGGQGNGNLDPIEMVRVQSIDRVTWTNYAKSIHHSRMCEAMNSNLGYVIPCGGILFNFRSNAVMYNGVGDGDNTNPQIGQVAIAIAANPVATVAAGPEDGNTQVASDNFPTAGPLSSNWTIPTGAGVPKVVSAGVVEPTLANTQSVACYTGTGFGSNQYSDITLKTLTTVNNDFTSPIVYCQTGAQTYYEALLTATIGTINAIQVNVVVAGVATPIGPSIAMTPKVGDVIRIAAVQTTAGTVITVYQNQYTLINIIDENSTITSGFPGFSMYGTTIAGAQISAWDGGNVDSSQILGTSTFSPPAGTYVGAQTVTVSNYNSGLAGFAMYYTLDGSTPTISSTLYTGPIRVSSSETIKVLAVATGFANSAIASAAYTINAPTGGGNEGMFRFRFNFKF